MWPIRTPSHKTRYIAFVAASADGRISLTKKTLPKWTSEEDRRFFQHALSKIDAMVVGRNTYLAASAHLRHRTTFVLSSRLLGLRRRGTVTFVNPNRIDLTTLFRPYHTVAVLGGGMVYREMLERSLLDEIYITLEPLIFGRGNEMFTGCTRTTQLRLVSVRRLNHTGTLVLHYLINHS